MNAGLIEQSLPYLPSFFRYLPGTEFSKIKSDFGKLFYSLTCVDEKVRQVYLNFAQSQNKASTSYCRAFVGIESTGWDKKTIEAMLPVYAEYLEKRGTLLGLQLLVTQICPERAFQIHERMLPFASLSLDQFRFGSDERLTDEWGKTTSFCVRFSDHESEFEPETLARLRETIQKEVGPQLRILFRFKPQPKPIEPSKSYFLRLGENL